MNIYKLQVQLFPKNRKRERESKQPIMSIIKLSHRKTKIATPLVIVSSLKFIYLF